MYYQLSWFTYKLVSFYFFIFKVAYFAKKIRKLKKHIKFIIPFFFQKEIIDHTYIFTKFIDNFKFTLISKILGGVMFSLSAPKRWFIFYNLFSLRLTENLHEQEKFLKT